MSNVIKTIVLTRCESVPVSVCGSGCVTREGEEECQDTQVAFIIIIIVDLVAFIIMIIVDLVAFIIIVDLVAFYIIIVDLVAFNIITIMELVAVDLNR